MQRLTLACTRLNLPDLEFSPSGNIRKISLPDAYLRDRMKLRDPLFKPNCRLWMLDSRGRIAKSLVELVGRIPLRP